MSNHDPEFAGTSWAGGNVEIPRDRMKRPLVMNPEGTKRSAYRRTTVFIDAVEDQYNLSRWRNRQIVFGMGQRSDLVLKAASVTVEDKSTLNDVAWEAQQEARSAAASNIGTALHKLCERLDHGEKLGRIPDPHGEDIKAYQKCLAHFGIENVAIECFRVHDRLKVAGTADRIVKMNDRYYIADIKTGSIDYPHKIAMQMAMYRHSVPYNVETDQREEERFDIDWQRGLIIHLPAGEGRCELHWTDLTLGWRGCQVAEKVYNWRAVPKDDLAWPVKDQLEFPITVPGVDIIARVGHMQTVDDLRGLWEDAKLNNLITPDFTAAVRDRKAFLLAGAR